MSTETPEQLLARIVEEASRFKLKPDKLIVGTDTYKKLKAKGEITFENGEIIWTPKHRSSAARD